MLGKSDLIFDDTESFVVLYKTNNYCSLFTN